MKIVLVTLVSGIFVSLLTSNGVKKDIELFNQETQQKEIFDDSEYFEFEEEAYNDAVFFEGIFGKLEKNDIIEIEDIKVYEIEEEVDLGFNVKDYLPSNLNPYESMNSIEALEVEAKIAFAEVFKNTEQAILKVEDINVYEIEEEVNLGFDAKQYLPANFNPYQGMNSIEALEVEAKIVFAEVFGKTEQAILKVEDINVYEIEEEVDLNFDTKDYLPSDFNPYQVMNSKEALEVEAKIAFEAVFGKTEIAKEIVKTEDIVLYEIEEII